MKNAIRLIGPTIMIFIGLWFFENVVITFILFYSWLLFVPMIDKAFPKEQLKLTKKSAMLGIVSGLIFFLFIYGGLKWLHVYLLDIDSLRVLLLEWGFSGADEIGLVLVLLLANPILEEVYWRGYMFNRLRQKGTAFSAIALTALFYTLYHLLSIIPIFAAGYSFATVIPVLIAGLFWGFIRERTGSISATMIGHVLADLGIMCVYWFIIRG